MRHRILVVEDNQPNRELLTDWLEAAGFEVMAAQNLEQAFVAFKTQKPDAILLDIQLGTEDGLTLAAWVRQEQKSLTIPVIAVTAHARATDKERIIQAGCNACISKPIDFMLLREQLWQWLTVARVFRQKTPVEA